MADRRKYIRSNSGYVRKSLHQLTPDGNIYEQDFMTISELPNFAPGQIPIYNDSNFIFTIRKYVDGQYNVVNGSWLKNGDNDFWTKENMGEVNTETSDSTFIKPYFSDLTDFAYYGSAVELVRATINKIIKTFPAGIYISDKRFTDYRDMDGNEVPILNGKFLVENPFKIDYSTKSIGNVENPHRFFCLKYMDFEINGSPVKKWEPYTDFQPTKQNPCPSNGTLLKHVIIDNITIYFYYVDGKEIACTNSSDILIKPQKHVLDSFFRGLDDFSKVILNKDTCPLYKSCFNTYFELNGRLRMSKKEFIWPIASYGYNLEIIDNRFRDYIGELIEMATFYDNIWSDNFYRSMSHESIKNLDWTFARFSDDENIDNDDLDFSRMQMMMRIYGRQLDEIKRYIDGIGFLNNISYNQENNPTDYTLTDLLELSGWEVKNLFSENDNTISKTLYSGESGGYTMAEANAEFLRRLKLNSSYIFSQKGTEKGLVTLLSLFGMEYGTDKDYYFIETIYEVGNLLDKEEVENINTHKSSFDITYQSEYGDLSGIPVKEVNGKIVPWFESNKKYDDTMYFEMAGGWDERDVLNVSDVNGKEGVTLNTNAPYYKESQKYVKYVNDIDELLNLPNNFVNNGDFVYVSKVDDRWLDLKSVSHYFYIHDLKYVNEIDYNWHGGELETLQGWYPLTIDEVSISPQDTTVSELGGKLLQYLAYNKTTIGNNPHFGNKKYDSGKSWMDRFNSIFKPSVEKLAAFVGVDGLAKNEESIVEIGFGIDRPTSIIVENICRTGIKTYIVEDDLEGCKKLNSKQFEIVFNVGNNFNLSRDFVEEYVLFYLKQIIPSTTILKINYRELSVVHGKTIGNK